MEICGQQFSPALVQRLQETLDREPELSRTALSRRVCGWLDWRSPNGRWKEMSCRVALARLEACGDDPPAAGGAFLAPPRRPPLAAREGGKPTWSARLEELQPVEVVPVGSAESRTARTWNELMDRYHPHGAGPLCGAQMRYAVRSRQGEWLGGVAFSAAAWRLAARDDWIGWSDPARREHLQQVIANSRFLILPHWRVPNLASHVLSLALQQVADDWQERYGYRPLLVETFVDAKRFTGVCYRAGNWLEVGQTTGRGRQDREHSGGQAVKRVFLYALHPQARELLGGQAPTSPPAPADWAEEEFGGASLGDARLRERLLLLARDFYARPQANLPQACQTRARTKAAYYFLEHPETSMDALLKPHYEATRQRVAAEPWVFAVQDTTFLNYSAHPETDDLGPIGSDQKIIGLVLHSTLAFNAAGTPLGFLDVQCWARDPQEFGKRSKRKELPIAEKESMKWLKSFQQVAEVQGRTPSTRLVSVGDREADIYELFKLALGEENAPGLLVRAERDRLLPGGARTFVALGGAASAGRHSGSPSAAAGQAAGAGGAAATALCASHLARAARQRNAGRVDALGRAGAGRGSSRGIPTPLRWMLLTTCPVESFADACEKVSWYTLRWGIEVYHRTLKSGCKIEQRQLGTAERIEACLAIDLVVAWRIFHLAKLGREVPDVPCSVYFEEAEWKALLAYITHNPKPPESDLRACGKQCA